MKNDKRVYSDAAKICAQRRMDFWERVVFALVGVALQGSLLGVLVLLSAGGRGGQGTEV